MRRAILVLTLLLAACGGVSADDVPPTGTIWFGSSFDTQTFALTNRRTSVKTTEPIAIVGHLTRSVDENDLLLRVTYEGTLVSNTPATLTSGGEVVGFALNPLGTAGSWLYELTDIGGNVLASGTVSAV